MGDVLIVEATQHVNDGIRLANVGQELVAQAFALAGALHQTGNVDNLHRSGYDTPRMNYFGQFLQTFVGNGDDAHVGLDGTKRKIGSLSLSVAQAIKEG